MLDELNLSLPGESDFRSNQSNEGGFIQPYVLWRFLRRNSCEVALIYFRPPPGCLGDIL